MDETWLMTVEADGVVSTGVHVSLADHGLGWSIGPDGTAYVVADPVTPEEPQVSVITAFDLAGPRPGWPVRVEGVASVPAFGPDGLPYLTVGSYTQPVSHTIALDRDGRTVPVASASGGQPARAKRG